LLKAFHFAQILSTIQSNCYQTYPIVFGKDNAEAYFQTLDMDPQSNLIVGGSYQATSSDPYRPLVGYVSRVSSTFQWLNMITNTGTNEVV